MDFFRRPEKRPTTFDHSRILVPLLGEPSVDDPALKVAALIKLGGNPRSDAAAADDDDPHELLASSFVSARRHQTGAVELRMT